MKIAKLLEYFSAGIRASMLAVSATMAAGMAVAQVNIAQTPLFLTSSAEPNLMFVLDDSGSMHWEITPDDYVLPYFTFRRIAGLYGAGDYINYVASVRYDAGNLEERATARALRSFSINRSYYNPAVTYRPWARADGTLFPNAVPTAAYHHPIRTGLGTRNLTINNTERAIWVHRSVGGTAYCSINCTDGVAANELTHYPAVYFRYNGGAVWDAASYTRVNIISTTATYTGDGRGNRTDCVAGTCTYAQEIRNFANWYTYYRSRMLAAQAGIGRAFSTQPEEMRVGFGAINKGSTTVDGQANTSTVIRGVRPFAGTNREGFFAELYEGEWDPANTPLRRALDDVGQYFSRADNRGPWGAVPGTNNTTNHLTCRQSYTILMTDGYWNDAAASTSGARANVDGSNGSLITGPDTQSYTYNSATPFTDAHSDTLADVAMYYWNRDLRPDLENKVPTSERNPAFWQHMITYGVGLGVSGSVDSSAAFGAITADPPGTINWPNPTSSNAAKIDDLLHAAVNSRGGFFSAADPDTFANQLSDVLNDILHRVAGSGTSAAASSAVLRSDTLLYTASFNSDDWSGNIVAKDLDDDGNATVIRWNAEQSLAAREPSNRRIYTQNVNRTTVELLYGNLDSTQQTALGVNPTGAPTTSATAADRVNWLRGGEVTGLRSRMSAATPSTLRLIGDIVGSDPLFVSKQDYGYSLIDGAESGSYNAFLSSSTYQNRPDVVYVGTNGGMLHAFHAGTPFQGDPPVMDTDGGNELFAYVPSELLSPGATGAHAQINELMRADFSHRFYVDGAAGTSDAYWDGEWRTVLVGSMGVGGRTVFALDVTDPESFDASKVLWEFRHSDAPCVANPSGSGGSQACRDIGYGITNPKVVRLPSGRWAVVFGNGYNSGDHRAKLFVVDLRTGRLLYLVDTGVGSASVPNGMAPVATTDWPRNDLNLSRVYAGDLRGNMWRVIFPVTGAPSVSRLFTATDSTDAVQPITAKPGLAIKPGSLSDIVVTFGTGSFFRVGDDNISAPQEQTFYGIFDHNASPATNVVRNNLLEQDISSNAAPVTVAGHTWPAGSLRFVSEEVLQSTHRGWFLDLPGVGERVISEPQFPSGATQRRVRFSTLIPDPDPCGTGRSGYVMDISLLNGGQDPDPVFDLNGDGDYALEDTVGGVPPSGLAGSAGEKSTSIRASDSATDHLYDGAGNKVGDSRNTAGPAGRQSWRQLR